jgi:diguanylate cyclase (GGDEF)-like protein/PAS domain S-box-containing protein
MSKVSLASTLLGAASAVALGWRIRLSLRARQKRDATRLAARYGTEVLLAQQQRMSDLLEQDIVGVAQCDAQGQYTLVNDRYCAILGIERSGLMGRRHAYASRPQDHALFMQLHRRVLQERRHFVVEQSFLRHDDQPCWLQLAVTVHLGADGLVDSYMLLALDISEQRQQEKAWRDTAEILTVAEQAAGAGAWRWRCAPDLAEWSPEMFRLLGLDPRRDSASFESWIQVIHPQDREVTLARTQAHLEKSVSFIDSYRVLHADGRVIWIDCHGKVVQRDAQGRATELAGVCIDVTAKKEYELTILQLNAELEAKVKARTAELLAANEELRHLARHDPLTGLPNRLAANERRQLEFIALQRSGKPCAVMLIDVDHFKQVNDNFGHAVGDRVLRRVGRCLASSLRESDFVARWGGEEFLVLLPGTELDAATRVADKLRQAVESRPDPEAGTITISLGLALATPASRGEDAPLSEADACLYAAKRAGRNRLVTTQPA